MATETTEQPSVVIESGEWRGKPSTALVLKLEGLTVDPGYRGAVLVMLPDGSRLARIRSVKAVPAGDRWLATIECLCDIDTRTPEPSAL